MTKVCWHSTTFCVYLFSTCSKLCKFYFIWANVLWMLIFNCYLLLVIWYLLLDTCYLWILSWHLLKYACYPLLNICIYSYNCALTTDLKLASSWSSPSIAPKIVTNYSKWSNILRMQFCKITKLQNCKTAKFDHCNSFQAKLKLISEKKRKKNLNWVVPTSVVWVEVELRHGISLTASRCWDMKFHETNKIFDLNYFFGLLGGWSGGWRK